MSFSSKLYTADLHLGHHGILRHCPATRPYDTVEAMDAAIIANINERVTADDILYIVGDFAISGDAAYIRHLFHSIRCRKVIVWGNHDLDRKGRLLKTLRDLPWDQTPTAAMETTDEGSRLYLHHYACRVWPAGHHGSYHFYGHSHGNLPPQGRSRDVGIDCRDANFAPMTFREIQVSLVTVDPAWHESMTAAFGAAVPSLESFRIRPLLQPLVWQMYSDLEARGLLQSVEIVGLDTRERGWVTIHRLLDSGLSTAERRAVDELLTDWEMNLSEGDRRD